VRLLDAALVRGGLTPLSELEIKFSLNQLVSNASVLSSHSKRRQAAGYQSGVEPPHSKG